MSFRLEGKVAVITGAGSGMGRAMAEMFAQNGAKVVCADISGNQDKVAAHIGTSALGVRADVTQSADVQRMIATAEERFGRLDILCNNAGYDGMHTQLHEQDEDNFDRTTAVNLKGVFLGMKYGIISMLKTGGGAIVNTSSATGIVGYRGLTVYSATKAGVNQMTKSAALEYAESNIRINAVCPGTIWTGMVPQSAGTRKPPEGASAVPGVPMKRWGLDRDIAAAALFLASDEAAYVTGITMPVDGGMAAG